MHNVQASAELNSYPLNLGTNLSGAWCPVPPRPMTLSGVFVTMAALDLGRRFGGRTWIEREEGGSVVRLVSTKAIRDSP